MPHDRDEWMGRIKAVEREYLAAQFAIDWLRIIADRDPKVLAGKLKLRDLREASERLNGTFIIRLFAEFEAGLRSYWSTLKGTHPGAQDLLEAIAARRRIGTDTQMNAHAVREYRNSLVHERDEPVPPITMMNTRSSLCRFFSFLPRKW